VYELCRILFIVFMVLKISPLAEMVNVVVWWRREMKSMPLFLPKLLIYIVNK
jgi:hypothetical protein